MADEKRILTSVPGLFFFLLPRRGRPSASTLEGEQPLLCFLPKKSTLFARTLQPRVCFYSNSLRFSPQIVLR